MFFFHVLADFPPAGDVLSPWNEDHAKAEGAENNESSMEVTKVVYEPVLDGGNKIATCPPEVSLLLSNTENKK